jgi:hypothetical protein
MAMSSEVTYRAVSPAAFWTGWILSLLPGLFLLLDAAMKLVKPEFVVTGTVEMGYAESVIVPLGIVLLVCTLLYLFPRTAVLGAILLTGYLGGAVNTHVRHQDPTWTVLFPAVFGVILWCGLVLREPRLRALVPWRS